MVALVHRFVSLHAGLWLNIIYAVINGPAGVMRARTHARNDEFQAQSDVIPSIIFPKPLQRNVQHWRFWCIGAIIYVQPWCEHRRLKRKCRVWLRTFVYKTHIFAIKLSWSWDRIYTFLTPHWPDFSIFGCGVHYFSDDFKIFNWADSNIDWKRLY